LAVLLNNEGKKDMRKW